MEGGGSLERNRIQTGCAALFFLAEIGKWYEKTKSGGEDFRQMDIIKELKRDGMLLKEISKKKQTKEICKIAVKQNPLALQFVSPKFLDSKLCLLAVKKDGRAFRYVPNQFITREMCELAVEADPELLNNVPEVFRTVKICLNAVKRDVSTLSYLSQEKRYELFNEKTELNLIERVVNHSLNNLIYMPDRQDVKLLCIKYMEENFSVARYMPELIKKSIDILRFQKLKGRVEFIDKYYDDINGKFKVKIKVSYGQSSLLGMEVTYGDDSYCITVEFDDFSEFYEFLCGDIVDADLRTYNFEGINLKDYDIDGAIINSDVLQLQGLYDDSYFTSIKKCVEINECEEIAKHELTRPDGFYYPKPIDDGKHEKFDVNHIPFFYISDIHLEYRVSNEFHFRASKEEIRFYLKNLARKLIASIGSIPNDSYLLIAGDTSCKFQYAAVFYNELIEHWTPHKIIVISGNHELRDPYIGLEDNIEVYREFFSSLNITFLQNDLLYVESSNEYGIIHEKDLLIMSEEAIREQVQYSSVIILGGIGFSGLNLQYNASNIRYGKSFEELSKEDAWKKDIQEANRFNTIYKKILKSLYKKRVIILTHAKKEDWNEEEHNACWIYLNGHNHQNFYEVSDKRIIYADNQIGYKAKSIGLKYFYCDNDYDIFAYYQDGIYKITNKQYIDFNRGKSVLMHFGRVDGTIYMLKRKNVYMFVSYCLYSARSKHKYLYLMNGGQLVKLRQNKLEDLYYYYDNLERYIENVNQLLNRYTGAQQKLSEFIKCLGGSGKIHGCIVDVERPDELEGFSYCHLFVNPSDGKVTPYFAKNVKSRIVYKDFKALLQAHSRCKMMADVYLQFEKESIKNIPVIQYSEENVEWGNEVSIYDEGGYLYKISRIIKSLQYCTEKNIVRIWNDELLNYDFVTRIKQANRINDMIDDRLIIDEEI